MFVWVILVPYAFQRRKLFRSVLSKKWRHFVIIHTFYHQWTDEAWYSWICLFSPTWSYCRYVWKLCTTLRSFILVALSIPVCMLYLLTLLLLPLMGCNWLFFLVMSLVVHTTVRFSIVTLASESGSNINSTILYLHGHPFITEWACILWKHG